MEHIDIENSWESQLQFDTICSVEIRSRNEVILEKNIPQHLERPNEERPRRSSERRAWHRLLYPFSRMIFRFFEKQCLTSKLLKILIEHIYKICSLESKLLFMSICSIKFFSLLSEKTRKMKHPFLFLLVQEDSVSDNSNVAINMNTQIKLDNVVLLDDNI